MRGEKTAAHSRIYTLQARFALENEGCFRSIRVEQTQLFFPPLTSHQVPHIYSITFTASKNVPPPPPPSGKSLHVTICYVESGGGFTLVYGERAWRSGDRGIKQGHIFNLQERRRKTVVDFFVRFS